MAAGGWQEGDDALVLGTYELRKPGGAPQQVTCAHELRQGRLQPPRSDCTLLPAPKSKHPPVRAYLPMERDGLALGGYELRDDWLLAYSYHTRQNKLNWVS